MTEVKRVNRNIQPVELEGLTERFSGDGRKLGYPTANIRPKTKLEDGVYAGTASLRNYMDKLAMIFIGTPTTMGDTDRRTEVYLFGIPDKDYYGLKLSCTLNHYLRPNYTFQSAAELKQVMDDDASYINGLEAGKA